MSKNTHTARTKALNEWLVSKNILKFSAGIGLVKANKTKRDIDIPELEQNKLIRS